MMGCGRIGGKMGGRVGGMKGVKGYGVGWGREEKGKGFGEKWEFGKG